MAMPRKRPLQDPNQQYAYVWRLDGEVIWVGCGKNNRCRPECKASWGGRPTELIRVLKVKRFLIVVEVLPCESKPEAIELERKLIAELKPKYNTATQAGGWKGMHSEEGLKSISQANLGKQHTDEFKEHRRQLMLGNQNLLGHIHTEETRGKIGAKAKGRPVSELCRQKSRERMIERNRLNPPRKGKLVSEEHRRKISIAAKNRKKRHASDV